VGERLFHLGEEGFRLATPASVRVRAAEAIFNHAAKAIEIEDIDARVSELERAAGTSQQGSEEREAMKTAQIHKRLESLATKFRPSAIREFTLEELCRLYWQRDKRGFTRFAERECPSTRIFVAIFQQEDADSRKHDDTHYQAHWPT